MVFCWSGSGDTDLHGVFPLRDGHFLLLVDVRDNHGSSGAGDGN